MKKRYLDPLILKSLKSEFIESDFSEFKKCLKIVIPKYVISDSRPKAGFSSFYNPNKQMLMDIMGEIYRNDELLQNTTLLGKYFIMLKIYIKPTKVVEDIFGFHLLDSELIECVAIKDNDNIEKVHWDVLQDEQFHIILDDSFISGNMTRKYWSYNPRVEIYIYSDSNSYNNEYMDILNRMEKYKKYLCTRKAFGDDFNPALFWERLLQTNLSNKKGSNNKVKAIFQNYSLEELDMIIMQMDGDNKALLSKMKAVKIRAIYDLYIELKASFKIKRPRGKKR